MRGRSPVLRRGIALLILVLLLAPAVLADDGTTLPEPPGARIGVPGGATSTPQQPLPLWKVLLIAFDAARIGVPIG